MTDNHLEQMQQDIKNIFMNNLRYYMAEKSITQVSLVQELGLKKTTVSAWYNGRMIPRLDKMVEIAFFLDIDVSDLLRAPEEKDKNTAIFAQKQKIENHLNDIYDFISSQNLSNQAASDALGNFSEYLSLYSKLMRVLLLDKQSLNAEEKEFLELRNDGDPSNLNATRALLRLVSINYIDHIQSFLKKISTVYTRIIHNRES